MLQHAHTHTFTAARALGPRGKAFNSSTHSPVRRLGQDVSHRATNVLPTRHTNIINSDINSNSNSKTCCNTVATTTNK